MYDVERPETPNDSRNITEDVSSSISRCICTTAFLFFIIFKNVYTVIIQVHLNKLQCREKVNFFLVTYFKK